MAAHRHEVRLAGRGTLTAAVLVMALAGLPSSATPAGADDLAQLPTATTLPVVSVPPVDQFPTATTTVPVVSVPPVAAPPVAVVPPPSSVDLGGLVPSTGTAARPAPKSPGAAGVGPGTGGSAVTEVPSQMSPVAPAPVPSVTVHTPVSVGDDRTGATAQAGVGEADPRPVSVRLRRAAAETVQQLTFPMGLALAALVFLMLHHRLDKGDPRLVVPADSGDDDLLGFT